MKVVLLGAGRVGSGIARDLAGEFDVTVVDTSSQNLQRLEGVRGLRPVQADATDPAILGNVIAPANIVVGAVPGPLGYRVLRTVLEHGKDVVDISFFEEDAFELDGLARKNGCVAVVDCGVAPGCSNLLLGRHAAEMEVERFWCAVGGLPEARHWPFEYKAPFSPIDVIAEYTRPARFRRGGSEVAMPALSEVELVDVAGVGTLEAFNTDGLRTLLRTLPVHDMVEKTLRYPGHAERMRMLREAGFFAEHPVQLQDGSHVRPLDLAAALLFRSWRFGEGEADLTVMRVIVEGARDGTRVRHTYDLLDRYDVQTGTASMTRTTGFTCTAAVRLLAAGLYDRPGITPPELLARVPGCVDFILDDLSRHDVVFRHSQEQLRDDRV